MILLLLATATAAPAPAAIGPADSRATRYARCLDLVQTSPGAARLDASNWQLAGGGQYARQCAGLAFAAEKNWTAAAGEFEAAARAARDVHDKRTADYWAQAGNAWLAGGDAGKARTALDSALVADTLTGLALGEAELDHARALVALGDNDGAREDLDLALTSAAADPLAWLLSATLARRMGDVPRAKKDIGEALIRSADDASVQFEAGNIAALARDEAAARTAWATAARLSPDSAAGHAALAALRQFDGPAKPPAVGR